MYCIIQSFRRVYCFGYCFAFGRLLEEQVFEAKAQEIVDEVIRKAVEEVNEGTDASGDSAQTVASPSQRYHSSSCRSLDFSRTSVQMFWLL